MNLRPRPSLVEALIDWLMRRPPETTPYERCARGEHDPYVGTRGREGYVTTLYCRRLGCYWTAMQKGSRA